ncbi:MAG: molybdopterin-dependent oxidoreductase [Actinomycetia bacterium]|nr:molybdopterin-dependent oxidoreductase [Actinomycetes bacterium]
MPDHVHFKTCPLCEATCGLSIEVRDGEVLRIRGDMDDVFSKGFICPKGSSLKGLQNDPDRIRVPLLRRDGELVETDWETAFALIDDRLPPILAEHGKDAVGLYTGNPWSHNLGSILYLLLLYGAIGRNRFAAASIDQRPREIVSGVLYGARTAFPVPDLDRTELLLLIGSDPLESNGSIATAPDWPGRLRHIQERGGQLIVVDPRRSKTAELADDHLSIVPGTDAAFLAGIANVCFADGIVSPGAVGEFVDGLDDVGRALAPFTPEIVAPVCGINPGRIRSLAHQLADSRAAIHGRLGTCLQEFGTLSSWLVDVVSICTGNLDVEGGAMFAAPAAMGFNTTGQPRFGPPSDYATFHSRVSGLPGAFDQLPATAMIDEIETPGDGQIKALITIAGNPVLSTPDSDRLARALDSLDFMVSVDPYVNETTRHADVILPPPTPLERSHYDLSYYQFSLRNIANYSPPVLPLGKGFPNEWEIMLRLAAICQGRGATSDIAAADDEFASLMVMLSTSDAHSTIHKREHIEILNELAPNSGPERLLDLALRVGPYGDGFGVTPDGLTLDRLISNPHGIDLGALRPRIPDMLRTPSGRIDLAYPAFVGDLERLSQHLTKPRPPMLLIGRRHLRSNNSWQHNIGTLMKGKPRFVLQVHPEDAERLRLTDRGYARVTSSTGSLVAPVEVSDTVMCGVVSLPHGWGHDVAGTRMAVASERPGANVNVLGSSDHVDPLSGNPQLNGIAVSIEAIGT